MRLVSPLPHRHIVFHFSLSVFVFHKKQQTKRNVLFRFTTWGLIAVPIVLDLHVHC